MTKEPIQPNCANVNEITTTKRTSTNDKNSEEKPEPTKSNKQTTVSTKKTTHKDNSESLSKTTSTVSMKQITTGKPDTTPNGAERLSYYDR